MWPHHLCIFSMSSCVSVSYCFSLEEKHSIIITKGLLVCQQLWIQLVTKATTTEAFISIASYHYNCFIQTCKLRWLFELPPVAASCLRWSHFEPGYIQFARICFPWDMNRSSFLKVIWSLQTQFFCILSISSLFPCEIYRLKKTGTGCNLKKIPAFDASSSTFSFGILKKEG